MAVLTRANFAGLWQHLYQAGLGKEEFRTAGSLPSKDQAIAAFQVIEDFWDTNQATMKVGVESALGRTLSATVARKFAIAWMKDKIERLEGV